MPGAEPPQEWPAPTDPHPSRGTSLPAQQQPVQPHYPAHLAHPASAATYGHGPGGHRNVGFAQHPWMHGREREYLLALILTVVTLGIYHFYYHYKTHDELCAQLGRPNDIKPLFIAYVVVMVGSLMLVLAPVGLVAGMVLLGFIVVRQYAAIHDARRRLGLVSHGDATIFLLWNYVGAFIIVGPFIAYYNMVQNYNDIWGALRRGAHLDTDAQAGQGPGAGVASTAVTHAPFHAPAHTVPMDTRPADSLSPGGVPGAPARSAGDHPAPGPTTAEATPAPATGFSVRARHEPPAFEGVVEQRFSCPRCQTHVAVHGTEGETVPVRCGACGETGEVRIGD